MIFSLTDETYSLVSSGNEDMSKRDYHRYCFYLSLMDQFYWVTGSVVGGLLGELLTIDTTGIDFILTALFISIFVQQWIDNKDKRPAVIGVAVTVVCRVLFGSETFLIPSMVFMTAALFLIRPKEDVSFSAASGFVLELIASAVVVGMHVWKKNTILSIASGTAVYMCLIQLVF